MAQLTLSSLKLYICEVHRPRIARDGGGVTQTIGQSRIPCQIFDVTPPAVDYDYRKVFIANVPFYIYIARLMFNYKLFGAKLFQEIKN